MAIFAEDLRRYLSEASGRPVRLRINDNLHSLVSCGRDGTGPGIRISLHRMFLDADEQVLESLAAFVSTPNPEARRVIREFINTNRDHIVTARSPSVAPKVVRGSARGDHLDLEPRAAAVNARHFAGALRYRIIWGRQSPTATRRQRHVTLGTWNERQRIIRIHPILDNPRVPLWFVDFVIYHEMVHIAIPSEVDCNGRMLHHSEEFRLLEQKYPDYLAAMKWEKRWLGALLREWHGGPHLPSAAGQRP